MERETTHVLGEFWLKAISCFNNYLSRLMRVRKTEQGDIPLRFRVIEKVPGKRWNIKGVYWDNFVDNFEGHASKKLIKLVGHSKWDVMGSARTGVNDDKGVRTFFVPTDCRNPRKRVFHSQPPSPALPASLPPISSLEEKKNRARSDF
jgi:hypothetical protein